MNFDDLRREFDEEVIGDRLWAVLLEVTGAVARRYPPSVYNEGRSWMPGEVESLAMDVVAIRLLGQRQIHAVFALATSVSDVRRLMRLHVAQELSSRRRTPQTDRLVQRSITILEAIGCRIRKSGRDAWLSLDSDLQPRTLSDAEVLQAASSVSDIMKLYERPGSLRRSKVYTASDLETLLVRVLDQVGGLLKKDLAKLFDILLTGWMPTFLEQADGESSVGDSSDFDAAEAEESMAVVVEFVDKLTLNDCVVLLAAAQGSKDADTAKTCGKSRPWVVGRRQELLARVENELMSGAGVDPDDCVEYLFESVSRRLELEEGDDNDVA